MKITEFGWKYSSAVPIGITSTKDWKFWPKPITLKTAFFGEGCIPALSSFPRYTTVASLCQIENFLHHFPAFFKALQNRVHKRHRHLLQNAERINSLASRKNYCYLTIDTSIMRPASTVAYAGGRTLGTCPRVRRRTKKEKNREKETKNKLKRKNHYLSQSLLKIWLVVPESRAIAGHATGRVSSLTKVFLKFLLHIYILNKSA